jgi:hypothetical protein
MYEYVFELVVVVDILVGDVIQDGGCFCQMNYVRCLGTMIIGFHECGHKEQKYYWLHYIFIYSITRTDTAYRFFFLDMAVSMSVSQSVMDETLCKI